MLIPRVRTSPIAAVHSPSTKHVQNTIRLARGATVRQRHSYSTHNTVFSFTRRFPIFSSTNPALTMMVQPETSRGLSTTAKTYGERNFITLRDFSASQIKDLIKRSAAIRNAVKVSSSKPGNAALGGGNQLHGKTLAMLFTKKSTRTRISSEAGWAYYGGHPLFLGANDIQLSGGEPLKDTSIVIGSMVDCILARVGEHEEILTLAENSRVPVINALTEKFHPLQGLADIMTIYETRLSAEEAEILDKVVPDLPPLTIAWVGDSNNIINSLLVSLPRLGPITLKIVTPKEFPVDQELLQFANANLYEGASIEICHTPRMAVTGADIIVTDTWISMGHESEKKKRLQIFDGFQITNDLCEAANKDWTFMHCLPRKQEEVDDEVFYDQKRSIVWREAENRKYTVMAVYEWIMGLSPPKI